MLFLDQTDTKLHSLKDFRATLKSLGLHTPAPRGGIVSCSHSPDFTSPIKGRILVTEGAEIIRESTSSPHLAPMRAPQSSLQAQNNIFEGVGVLEDVYQYKTWILHPCCFQTAYPNSTMR